MDATDWIAVAALAVSCVSLYFSLMREWQSRHLSTVQRRHDLLRQIRHGIRAVEAIKERLLKFENLPRVRLLADELAALEAEVTSASDKQRLERIRSEKLAMLEQRFEFISRLDDMIRDLHTSHSTIKSVSGSFASHWERVRVERLLNSVAEFGEGIDSALADWSKVEKEFRNTDLSKS
jgi:hypothetical protein